MKTRGLQFFGTLLLASLLSADKNPGFPTFRGMNYALGGYNPMYQPRRTKFKGWMRENRRCTFNKNR
jgi:hypothetical protein